MTTALPTQTELLCNHVDFDQQEMRLHPDGFQVTQCLNPAKFKVVRDADSTIGVLFAFPCQDHLTAALACSGNPHVVEEL